MLSRGSTQLEMLHKENITFGCVHMKVYFFLAEHRFTFKYFLKHWCVLKFCICNQSLHFSATLQSVLVVTKLQNADSQLDVTSLGFSFILCWSSPRNAFFDSLKFSLFFFRVLRRSSAFFCSAFFCFTELRSATSFFRELT